MQVTFLSERAESDNISTFFFTPERHLRYTAGQFVELRLPHENVDDRGDSRWFTLSSSPTSKLLSITTEFTDLRGSSFKKALKRLEPGVALSMSDPLGDFVLPRLVQTPLIFVAGGIGVTPYCSMLQWIAATNDTRDIKMIYGVSSEEEIIFQDVFESAGQHVTTIVSQPSDSWGGERGRVTADFILGLEKPNDETMIYLSGPELMIQTLTQDLYNKGVHRRQLLSDHFPGY